jgi:hypothetical protein
LGLPAYRPTDLLSERTADCPQKNQAGLTRACGAVMPDLVDLPSSHWSAHGLYRLRHHRRIRPAGLAGTTGSEAIYIEK